MWASLQTLHMHLEGVNLREADIISFEDWVINSVDCSYCSVIHLVVSFSHAVLSSTALA